MKISELKAGASNVDVKAEVTQKEEPREVVTKYGKRLSVASIMLKDDSGSISMSLWGEDIDKVDVGDVVEITNGYVSEFRGTPQLSAGKFGKIEVVGKSEGSSSADSSDDENIDEPLDEPF